MRKQILIHLIMVCCLVLIAGHGFAADEAVIPGEAGSVGVEKGGNAAAPEESGLFHAVFKKNPPRFGGDANFEYDTRDSDFGDSLTSRVRLTMDADLSPDCYLHTRLTAKQYIDGDESGGPAQAAGYENEAIKVGMEQLYLGYKFGDVLDGVEVIAGRQPLWLADGMLADINGMNSAKLNLAYSGINLLGFFGKDGTQALPEESNGEDADFTALEASWTLGPICLGATYLDVESNDDANDERFCGGSINYRAPFEVVFYGQYVVNSDADDDDTAYRIKASYGNAAKQGEWDVSLAYLRVEDNINPNDKWLVNDGNWVGAKGVRLKMHYALTNWATLILVQDVFENINTGENQNRTDIEFEVRF